jgi:hypothetical protein
MLQPVFDNLGNRNEKYKSFQADSFVEEVKYRHWLAAGETEIESRALDDWLPPADDHSKAPISIDCTQVGILHGGDAPQVQVQM